MKSRMRGGSPAYDYHVAEGFLNNEATILSNMGITQLESGPVENYANLYQISGGGRRRRRRSGTQRRRRSVKKSRRTSKRNTSSRQKRSNKRYGSRRRARSRTKRCGCGKKNK